MNGVHEVGVDEAGRGPAIGPLVVCALCVPSSDRSVLNELGVDDSKKLSRKKREHVFGRICSISEERNWGIGLIICDAEKIDEWMVSGTMNTLETKLFAEAILEAAKGVRECKIIVDACDVNESRFGKGVSENLGDGWSVCEIVSKHGMDSEDVVVGAASIIAKVNRDSEIDKISREIGMDVGSGYPSDPKTKDAIEKLCRGVTPHGSLRWGWANVQRSWIKQNKMPMPRRSPEQGDWAQSTLVDWEK